VRALKIVYLSTGLAYGVLYNFVPVLLEAKGFTAALVGLGTGLGALAYAVALPAWGHLGDTLTGPRRAVQIAGIPATAFALGLILPLPIGAIVGCQVMVSACGGPGIALTDSMAMVALKDPARGYAGLRLVASFGAGLSAIGCGLLYSRIGYLAAPLLFVVPMALGIVAAQAVPRAADDARRAAARAVRAQATTARGGRRPFGSIGDAVHESPRLLALLAAVVVLFIPVTAVGTFATLRISDLGGGAAGVGVLNGGASLAEVVGWVVGGRLVNRFGARTALLAGGLVLTAAVASWVWLTDPVMMIAMRIVAGGCFAAIVSPLVLSVAAILPGRLVSTGQTMLQAACWGVAALVSNVLGGVIYGSLGAVATFGVAAILAFVGTFLVWRALPRRVDGTAAAHATGWAALAAEPLSEGVCRGRGRVIARVGGRGPVRCPKHTRQEQR
jgi:MFS transporter, PPP family, 3-phenylpropionic acid transporter